MHFFTILATLSATAIAFPTWGRFVNGTKNGEADIHKTTVGDNNVDKSRNSATVSYDDHSPSTDVKDTNNKDNSNRPSLGSVLDKANVTVGPLTGDSPLLAVLNASVTRYMSSHTAKDNVYARGNLGNIIDSEGCTPWHAGKI
ncbi:hypothetical protein BDV36DRAFT_281538 [Aspergillus pseudocaelatus]|uniref:Uncharacterized protein n=1 Tax=Aspergillus pseudocaelatus TaxID=1825620 RepID=A0ABQ6WTK8_9EURO|nr:hypothetical protein BDV36DRAFT_281538 [Aspergillus pseudocaelatus]